MKAILNIITLSQRLIKCTHFLFVCCSTAEKSKNGSSIDSPQNQSATPTDMTTPEGVFAALEPLITDQTVRLINGSFLFELSGKNAGRWLLNLKNSPGLVGPVSEDTEADVRIKMSSEVMVDMFNGKLGPATAAVQAGKIEVLGNMALVLKLEKLIGMLRPHL